MWAFLVCDCRCCGDTLDSAGKYHTFFYVVCPNLQSTMNKKISKTFSLLDFSKKYGKVHIDPIDEIHMGTWTKFKRFFFYHDDEYYYVNVSPKLGLISMMDIVSEARKWLVVQFDDESYYLCPEEELINLLNDI